MKTSNQELVNLFFSELKKYNSTNFRTIARADLSKENATTYKSFSSVVTRFFIFAEKHSEISEFELRVLYYKLKIDMIASYFSAYPSTCSDNLRPFQIELQTYVNHMNSMKGSGDINGSKHLTS